MIHFLCPLCKAHINANDDMAGKTMSCPNCKQTVTVQASQGITTPAVAEAAERQKRDAARDKRGPAAGPPAQGSNLGTILVAVGAIAVLVAIIWAVMSTQSGGSGEAVVVVMDTSMGTVKMELYPDKAPITVGNFLKYVDEKHYDDTIFHRVIESFMIQGGGFTSGLIEKGSKYKPIRNEADNGMSNKRGTVAMARTNDPNSATDQFFINVVDNAKSLDRNPQSAGYAVFGKVIEGMNVVDEIRSVRTGNMKGHDDVPVKDVFIKSIRRAEPKKK